FDDKGNFTNAVTLNDNGTVTHLNDFGTYAVSADCTGKIRILGGTGTIDMVLVDGGKEFYGNATDPCRARTESCLLQSESEELAPRSESRSPSQRVFTPRQNNVKITRAMPLRRNHSRREGSPQQAVTGT